MNGNKSVTHLTADFVVMDVENVGFSTLLWNMPSGGSKRTRRD
jgi:hypothetical protein